MQALYALPRLRDLERASSERGAEESYCVVGMCVPKAVFGSFTLTQNKALAGTAIRINLNFIGVSSFK